MIWKEGPQPRVYPIYSVEKHETENKPKKLAGRMEFERPTENVFTKPGKRPSIDSRDHSDRFILRHVNRTKAFTLFKFPT